MRNTGRTAPLLIVPVLLALLVGALVLLDDDSDNNEAVTPLVPPTTQQATKGEAKLTGFEAVLGKLPVPTGNPQTSAKIELGKLLFFDQRLSGNNAIACATCHASEKGFSDGVARSTGSMGELGRNSMTIWNVAYMDFLHSNGNRGSLEDQAAKAIPGLAMAQPVQALIEELNGLPDYKQRFEKVFGDGISLTNIARAVAAFERTIISANSPWDKFQAGDKSALTQEQRKGRDLFFSARTSCSTCHTPPLFSDNRFHVLGVPQVGPKKEDLGRFDVTQDPQDKGAFKTPTLRNVEFSGPYMHTGGLATLEEVMGFYNAGGGPAAFNNKSKHMKPLNLTAEEVKQLVAFMKALSDNSLQITPPKLP